MHKLEKQLDAQLRKLSADLVIKAKTAPLDELRVLAGRIAGYGETLVIIHQLREEGNQDA